MSVKLVYQIPKSQIHNLQQLGGFCYCRRLGPGAREGYFSCIENKIDVSGPNAPVKRIKENPIVSLVNFGQVPVDTIVHQDFVIFSSKGKSIGNLSIEPKDSSNFDCAFRVVFSANLFLPELPLKECSAEEFRTGRKQKFRIYFEPQLASMHYKDSIFIWVDQEIPIRIDCCGVGVGPSVCFSENLLNFGGQYYREEGRMRFKMFNKSNAGAKFQFENDNTRSVFKICPTSGIIPPNAELTVEVAFQAPKPQTYYKRVTCLIHHQYTQYLDLIGLCIPRPFFSLAQIDFGLSTSDTQLLPLPTERNDEYFHSTSCWGVEFDQDAIDFGFRDLSSPAEEVGLTVSNFLPYDVIIEWINDPTGIFSISPQTALLLAEQSAQFQVSFQPTFPETFYAGELECYVYPTGYRWPEEYGGPPWIVSQMENFLAPAIGEPEQNTQIQTSPADSAPVSRLNSGLQINLNLQPGQGAPIKTLSEEELGEVSSRMTTSLTVTGGPELKKPKQRISRNSSKTKTQAAQKQHPPPKHGKKPHGAEHKKLRKKTSTRIKEDLNETAKQLELLESSDSKADTTIQHNTPEAEQQPQLDELDPSKLVTKLISRRLPRILLESNPPETGAGDGNKVQFPLNLVMKNYGSSCQDSQRLEPITPTEIVEIDDAVGEQIPLADEEEDETIENEEDASLLPEESVLLETETQSITNYEEEQEGEEKDPAAPSSTVPQELALPLCLTLKLTGHTTVKFSPVTHFKVPSKITMPPTWPGQDICRTILLKNDNDLPVSYNILQPQGDEVYFFKPMKGLIPGKFHQIFLVKMKSDATKNIDVERLSTSTSVQKAAVLLNFHDSNEIELRGQNSLPALEIVLCYDTKLCGFNLVFPETIPGNVVDTMIELRNPTRFHYKFSLVPSKKTDTAQVFAPDPSYGLISPYEATPNNIFFDLVELFSTKEETVIVQNSCNTPVRVKLRLLHDVWLQYFPKGQAKITPKKFILDALESIEVKIFIRPDKVSIQDFTIEYLLEPMDSVCDDMEGKGIAPIEFRKLCTFSFIGEHATIKASDIQMTARHPIWDAGQSWSMFSLSRFNELLSPSKSCLKEGNHGWMKIPNVTFRFPSAPLGSEHALFTILLTNHGTLPAKWKVYTEPPSGFPIYFQMKNFQATYDGHIREDKKFLATIWAHKMIEKYMNKIPMPGGSDDYDDPRSIPKPGAGCACIKPFRDYHLFKVSPKSGFLDPGEETLISFRYAYKEIGKHGLTLLLRIYPSLFLWITLRGTTLEPGTSSIQHMHKNEIRLVPIALSDLDPPIQYYWLFNGGDKPAPYEVDTKPFQDSIKENFGHPVWDCLNKSGVIPARAWGPIRIRFSPIEIKEYRLPLKVSTNGNIHTSVTLIGVPLLDPIQLRSPAQLCGLEIPDQRIGLIDPLVPMVLTPSRISFPHLVPTGQESNSLVFIKNISGTNEISFSWPVIKLDGGGSIRFEPDTGVLKPNSQQTCMIIVQGGKVCLTISRIIKCSMIDETAKAQFETNRKNWNSCKIYYMKKEGLDEKEAILKLLRKFSSKPVEPLPYSRIICVNVYISSVLGMLDHNTLKEQEKTIVVPRCKSLSSNPTLHHISPFTRELSKEFMANIIWDLITPDALQIHLNLEKLQAGKPTTKSTKPKMNHPTILSLHGSQAQFLADSGSRSVFQSRTRSIMPEEYVYGAGVRVPIYFDYKLVEDERKFPRLLGIHDILSFATARRSPEEAGTTDSDDGILHELILPGTGTQKVISNVLMNLIQEYSSEFQSAQGLPPVLDPVVPKEIVNMKKYPYYYM